MASGIWCGMVAFRTETGFSARCSSPKFENAPLREHSEGVSQSGMGSAGERGCEVVAIPSLLLLLIAPSLMTEDPTPVWTRGNRRMSRRRGRSGGQTAQSCIGDHLARSPQNGFCGQAFPCIAQDGFGRHETPRRAAISSYMFHPLPSSRIFT